MTVLKPKGWLSLEIVEFRKEHMDLFGWNILDAFSFKGSMFSRDLILAIIEKSFPVYTVLKDDKAIAFGGVVKLWDGVAEIWSILSPEAIEEIKPIHRKAIELIESCFNNGIVRMQTTVLEGFFEGYRWVEHLGFHQEGRMAKYGPDGQNYIRYARVKGG